MCNIKKYIHLFFLRGKPNPPSSIANTPFDSLNMIFIPRTDMITKSHIERSQLCRLLEILITSESATSDTDILMYLWISSCMNRGGYFNQIYNLLIALSMCTRCLLIPSLVISNRLLRTISLSDSFLEIVIYL